MKKVQGCQCGITPPKRVIDAAKRIQDGLASGETFESMGLKSPKGLTREEIEAELFGTEITGETLLETRERLASKWRGKRS